MSNAQRTTHNAQRKGQATVEYVILFAALAAITLLSVSSFYSRAKQAGEDLCIKATERIVRADE